MKVTITSSGGKKFELSTKKTAVTVGRSSKCDLIVTDEALSRQHALIEHDHENFYITDLGSSNGVFVDGERLPPHERHQINTFLQLTLSTLECQIVAEEADTPVANTSYRPPSPSSELTSVTKENIKLPRKSLPPKKSVKKSESASLRTKLTLFIVLVILAIPLYQLLTSEKVPEGMKSDQLIFQSNVPENLRSVPDQFLHESEYRAMGEIASCEGQTTVCEQLKLKPEFREGVVFKDNEYFIYFIPSIRENEAKYTGLQKFSNKATLLGVFALLNSNLFQEFQNKNFGQIHLILMDAKFNYQRVLRFHTKYYLKNGPERARLLTDLSLAMNSGDLDPYLKSSRAIVKTKEF